ncbi:hypothetical protein JCM8547_000366 [Rhodosporidiobolus lusitaniae]
MDAVSFSHPPARLAGAAAPSGSNGGSEAFFRDATLSPDGSCVLAAAEDRSLSLFPLPSDGFSSPSLVPSWTHQPSNSLLSTAWYPGASLHDPAMFAFAAAVKELPIHLLDGNDRRVRASYPIVDHVERFVAPHSMLFSLDGSSLYCGFDNAIEIFDVSVPGAAGFRLNTSKTRSSRDGQKGIVSSLASSYSNSSHFLAAGTFSGSIGLYDPSSPTPLFDLLYPSQRGGVTKLAFNPASPHLLFAASRQASYLDVWDLRNTTQPVSQGKLRRQGRTNQRLGFSIDPTGTWLAAGDQNGNLSIFSAQPLPDQLEPVATFSLSSEPLGATLFHPSLPLLITGSGTRHFRQPSRRRRGRTDDSGDDSSSSGSDLEADVDAETTVAEGEEPDQPSLEVWETN